MPRYATTTMPTILKQKFIDLFTLYDKDPSYFIEHFSKDIKIELN